MARPSVAHSGFLIPNAEAVSQPGMAEPDQIDYNTLAHAHYGVIDGCEVTVSGLTASTAGGTALVDGILVNVNSGMVTLNTGSVDDRFDLIVTDADGQLSVIGGTARIDPVFPDTPGPTEPATLLAVVFCPAGVSDFSDNVIDKRKFLAKSLLTKIASGDPLIDNRNGSGSYYLVTGQGDTSWNGDTTLKRETVGTLRVGSKLLAKNITADEKIIAGTTIEAQGGSVTGTNLRRGTSLPQTSYPTAPLGTIYQRYNTGQVYVKRPPLDEFDATQGWSEMIIGSSSIPLGTVIASFQDSEVLRAQGWVPLKGGTAHESEFPDLFTLSFFAGNIAGTAPNRTLILPDLRRRILLMDWDQPGVTGGASTVTLSLANMPSHKHDVDVALSRKFALTATTALAGEHRHSMTQGGAHRHGVDEEGHRHKGFDFYGTAAPAIVEFWGGTNSIDAFFNDRNHTASVEPLLWTSPAVTGVQVNQSQSAHSHSIDIAGGHSHHVDVPDLPSHSHDVSESLKGTGQSFSIMPSHYTVRYYMRAVA